MRRARKGTPSAASCTTSLRGKHSRYGRPTSTYLPIGRGGSRLEAALGLTWRRRGVLEGELADASGRLAIFHKATSPSRLRPRSVRRKSIQASHSSKSPCEAASARSKAVMLRLPVGRWRCRTKCRWKLSKPGQGQG